MKAKTQVAHMLVCHSYNEYLLIGTIHVAEIIAVKHFPAIRILGTSEMKYKINNQIK